MPTDRRPPRSSRAGSGRCPATAERVFDRLGAELEAVDIDGAPAIGLAEDLAEPIEPVRDVVRLLPQYDAFVLGSRPREQLIPPDVNTRIRAYRRGRFEGAVALSVVMVDGRIVGIWERSLKSKRVDLALELVEPISAAATAALEREVVLVGAALGLEPTVRLGPLGPG